MAAGLTAGDAGSHLAADEAALERAQQPPVCQDLGFEASLHLQTGSGMWAVPAQIPKAPAGEQEELPKPLVVQSSLLLPGAPHLLGCFSDDVLGVLKEEVSSVLLWEKPSGEELQSRGGQELVRSGRQGCAGQKAGGSHKRSHLAVGVDTELDRHSLVATDVGVRLGPVAEHARW